MKLAQVNLTRGILIPGLGSAMKLENLECEQQAHGLLVTTPTAKVLIPWERVESIVTEWITLMPKIQSRELVTVVLRKAEPVDPFAGSVAALQKNPPLTMEEFEATEAGKASAKQWTDNRAAVAQLAQAQGAVNQATPLTPQQQLDNDKAAAAQARAVPQPPPPTKKGGRR